MANPGCKKKKMVKALRDLCGTPESMVVIFSSGLSVLYINEATVHSFASIQSEDHYLHLLKKYIIFIKRQVSYKLA